MLRAIMPPWSVREAGFEPALDGGLCSSIRKDTMVSRACTRTYSGRNPGFSDLYVFPPRRSRTQVISHVTASAVAQPQR